MTTRERYSMVFDYFKNNVPVANTELQYADPFGLVVSVILSAQCTDTRVNQITPGLLARFPTPEAMSESTPEEIFTFISSCSYPNNKARHICAMAKKIVSDFGGKVPESLKELMSLPGVGRKSANVITLVAFNNPAMPVDTHVFRVSARIGLTKHAKTPEMAEIQLVKHIPEDLLPYAHHWLILHGRYTCLARKPKCPECGLKTCCLYFLNLQSNRIAVST
jgi:endonuclease III